MVVTNYSALVNSFDRYWLDKLDLLRIEKECCFYAGGLIMETKRKLNIGDIEVASFARPCLGERVSGDTVVIEHREENTILIEPHADRFRRASLDERCEFS